MTTEGFFYRPYHSILVPDGPRSYTEGSNLVLNAVVSILSVSRLPTTPWINPNLVKTGSFASHPFPLSHFHQIVCVSYYLMDMFSILRVAVYRTRTHILAHILIYIVDALAKGISTMGFVLNDPRVALPEIGGAIKAFRFTSDTEKH